MEEDEDFRPRVDLERAVRVAEARIGRADLESEPFIPVTWTQLLPEPRDTELRVHLRVLPSGVLPVALERETR